jgi:glycosyltransferase involved in cell wall biosynthesis
MKICFICSEYPPGPIGGVGTFTQTAARWLVEHGHQVKVIGTYPDDYPAAEYEVDKGVEVYRIKHPKGKIAWIPSWFKQHDLIKKWVNNQDVEIIEAPDSRGWFTFWGKINVPLLIRANGTETSFASELGNKQNKLTAFLENAGYHRADYYCAVSKYVAQLNERIFHLPKKHTILYNFLSNTVIKPNVFQREKDLIVFSGTLIEKKGVLELIQASVLLQKKGISHRLVLNGKDHIHKTEGSMKARLEKLIPDDLKDRYTFNGHLPQERLYQYYAEATAAIFPSFMEAFAFAPMEAMINSCPTIFTKRVSGPELIDDGVNGILVEPSNINEMADAMKSLLTDPEKAAKLGAEGKEKILNTFSVGVCMPKNVAYYESIIKDFKMNRER